MLGEREAFFCEVNNRVGKDGVVGRALKQSCEDHHSARPKSNLEKVENRALIGSVAVNPSPQSPPILGYLGVTTATSNPPPPPLLPNITP